MSVVIPTRDRPELLRRAVGDALGQAGVAVEVIVVDEASAPPAAEALAPLPRGVRVLRHETPHGVARARNAGVAAASAEWVAFLDDDDSWAPGHLAGLLDAVAGTRAALAFARHYVTDRGGRILSVGPDPGAAVTARDLVARNVIVTPSSALARRSAVAGSGGFDPALSISADWDLWLRLAGDQAVAVSPHVSVAYTQHGESMRHDGAGLLREHAVLERKHVALLARTGRGLGDALHWQWIAASLDPERQKRRAARMLVRRQRGHAPAIVIARELLRLVTLPRQDPRPAVGGAADAPTVPWDLVPGRTRS